jgi:hypothetical protein
MLDDDDKRWFKQLLDEKMEELTASFVGAQRAQERRKLLANENIPLALTKLDLLIEELTERVRKLEKKGGAV